MVPSGLSPRRSSGDRTPIAGMATDTGGERRSDGSFGAAGPIVPAAAAAGRRRVLLREDRDADGGRAADDQRRPGQPGQPDPGPPAQRRRGANWLSGHDMTTRSPPMRGERIAGRPRRLRRRLPLLAQMPLLVFQTAGRPFGPRGNPLSSARGATRVA